MVSVVRGLHPKHGRLVDVSVDNGHISATTPVSRAARSSPDGAQSEYPWILPGLVDLQVNGYAGVDFNDGHLVADEVGRLVEAEWQRGVTAFCPTLVSGPEELILDALSVIATARRSDRAVACAIPAVHVEGPYLSPEAGARGAHSPEHLRGPDLAELARWQGAAGGLVGLVTLAPELPGAATYIRAAAAQGIVIGIGHTMAGATEIAAAAEAGARLSTHLGNGCEAMIHRHANPIWPQLADDRLNASFIADGHHLPREAFKAMVRAKGVERSILVSDSVALSGSPPGSYVTAVGGLVELSVDRRLSLAGTGGRLLAGSVSCLPECVAWAVLQVGMSVADIAKMTCTNPWRLVPRGCLSSPHCHDIRGRLTPGACANLTLVRFDREVGVLRVDATVVGGEVVAGNHSLAQNA
jgi:N-acetylglucosamine-6-phosphate deacetylase